MTECERIVNAGILPESFFEEEIRCNFLVTKRRKKIWAVEIDLLLEFDRICKKHNLKYFLFWGSLLGAVRHGGFVPWDDDIDVSMPRKDYEKLITLKDEFSEPYFLQTPYTDKGYFYSHIKLRNSNTTAWDRPFAYQGYNFGSFLDILPLDNIILNNIEERFKHINKLILDNAIYMKLSNPKPAQKDLERIAKYEEGDPFERYEEIQRIARQFEKNPTNFIGIVADTFYDFKRSTYGAADFSKSVDFDFEGFKMPVPCGYLNVLNTLYGEWKKFPPIEKRGAWHSNVISEPDVPYKKYIEDNSGVFPDEKLKAQISQEIRGGGQYNTKIITRLIFAIFYILI